MNSETRKHIEALNEGLDQSAAIIARLSRMVLIMLDKGARELLAPGEASELEEAIGTAGARSEQYKELAQQSRDLLDQGDDE